MSFKALSKLSVAFPLAVISDQILHFTKNIFLNAEKLGEKALSDSAFSTS